MAAPLVTITRQYASGGSDIAARVAEQLGWTLVDNEFVEDVARRAGLPPDEVAQRDERAPGLLERLARTLALASPEMFITTAGVPRVEEDESTIVKLTERVIREAATHGRVVLVGRGAQALLAQRDSALHAYIIAPKTWRMKHAVERLGADAARVDHIVDEIDQQRDHYVRVYYGRSRQDLANYDLILNAERLGLDGAAAVIVAEVRRRGWT
jgi:cytidylate kinase